MVSKAAKQVKQCQSCNFTLVHTDNGIIVVIGGGGGTALERIQSWKFTPESTILHQFANSNKFWGNAPRPS